MFKDKSLKSQKYGKKNQTESELAEKKTSIKLTRIMVLGIFIKTIFILSPDYNENDYDQNDKNESPWKRLEEMKVGGSKDTKTKASVSSSKLSAYERQLIEEMETSNNNRSRLTTISEGNSKIIALNKSKK